MDLRSHHRQRLLARTGPLLTRDIAMTLFQISITIGCIVFCTTAGSARGQSDAQVPGLPAPHVTRNVAAFGTIVQKEAFRDPTLIAVVRRAPGASGDVIALRRGSAGPELLLAAMKALNKSRERDGEVPVAKIQIFFRAGMRFPPISLEDRIRMETILAQLRGAPLRDVPDIGKLPAIDLPLY